MSRSAIVYPMDSKTEGGISLIIGILGILFALIPIGWPKSPPIVSYICRILAGFCFLVFLYLITPQKYKIRIIVPATRLNKMWLIIGMILSGVIFLYCAVAHFVPLSEKPKTEPPTADEIASAISKKLPTVKHIPQTGNLKDRTIALVDEIMRDPKFQNEPISAEDGLEEWAKNRSNYFRWKYLARVHDIYSELSQLNYKNQELDDFIRYHPVINDSREWPKLPIIFPQEYSSISNELRELANKIPSQ